MSTLADDLTAVYAAQQVCQAARITYRQLDYAVRCGLVEHGRHAMGSGFDRRFRSVDVHVAAVLGRLSDLGVGEGARRAVVDLLYVTPRPWPASWLVIPSADEPHVYTGPDAGIVSQMAEAQIVLRLPPALVPLP